MILEFLADRGASWTKIHLILQASVPSIEQWNSQDRFDKVPLLRRPAA